MDEHDDTEVDDGDDDIFDQNLCICLNKTGVIKDQQAQKRGAFFYWILGSLGQSSSSS